MESFYFELYSKKHRISMQVMWLSTQYQDHLRILILILILILNNTNTNTNTNKSKSTIYESKDTPFKLYDYWATFGGSLITHDMHVKTYFCMMY